MVQTLIVGAGPAGMAMAGRLSAKGREFVILEKGDSAAQSWRNHYDRLHLHTIKQYSTLPHLDFPADYPEYVPRNKLVEYFDRYCEKFGIEPRVNWNVESIKSTESGWLIQRDKESIEAKNVVVATGFNRKPVVPEWPGQDSFGGRVLHSRDYRTGGDFRGQRVLVVGFGNTGAELALDLHEQGAQASVSIRGKVNVVPRDFWGRPTQLTAMMLNKLPTGLGDWIGTQLQKITVGDLSRWGIHQPSYPPAYQLREFGKTPVIDVGTIDAIKKGDIRVFPGIRSFDGDQVEFEDAERDAFDAVILATGYHSAVQDFVEDAEELLNRHGVPSACWFEDRPGLYFLGFDAYSSGLLWSIHLDSEKILRHMIDQGRI